MNNLTVKPASAADQTSNLPTTADTAISGTYRKGNAGRSARRRFNATRLSHPNDSGFRLFRVY